MRLIDDKGRLFGIINVFDLLVLAIIVIAAFFTIKWIHMGEDPSWVRVKMVHTLCVGECVVPDYMVEVVKEGDEMLNEEGLVVVRIEKILKSEPANVVVYSSKDGEKIFFDSKSRRLTVIADILSYERQGVIYSCTADTPLKIGGAFSIHTRKYSIQITVRKILEGGKVLDAPS